MCRESKAAKSDCFQTFESVIVHLPISLIFKKNSNQLQLTWINGETTESSRQINKILDQVQVV